MSKQEAKADAGKPQLTLVPRAILPAIARVREYGCKKYGDPDNWKRVEIERYRDAAFRHFMAYLDDPYGVDEESGLPHLAHLACNISFLCEMQKDEVRGFGPEKADDKKFHDDIMELIEKVEGKLNDKAEDVDITYRNELKERKEKVQMLKNIVNGMDKEEK